MEHHREGQGKIPQVLVEINQLRHSEVDGGFWLKTGKYVVDEDGYEHFV